MIEALAVALIAAVNNASNTLVSRARNSRSLFYHAIGAVISNTMFLLVFKSLTFNISNPWVGVAYVTGAVFGSVSMHHLAMKLWEKKP